jgi:endonuclease/exonuclease/phosphatase family metal-dependent hydrolase
LPVQTHHRKSEPRPQGRVHFIPASIYRWLLRLPILRWARRLKRQVQRVSDSSIQVISKDSRIPPKSLGGNPLTIVSANLWHDWPRFRNLPERLESFAQMIEAQGAQVVLLQEALQTPQLSASDWLAERLNMAQAYVRANGHQTAIGFEEGSAVLTSFPVREMQALPLRSSAAPFVRRMALGARLELGCCHMWVVSTHLGFLRRDNQRQIEMLRAWVGDLAGSETAVIGGDFNVGEESQQVRAVQAQWQDTFRTVHPVAEGNTHELSWPWGGILRRQRLDYLFLQKGNSTWQITDAEHLLSVPRAHSDHKAVLTRLEHDALNEHPIVYN